MWERNLAWTSGGDILFHYYVTYSNKGKQIIVSLIDKTFFRKKEERILKCFTFSPSISPLFSLWLNYDERTLVTSSSFVVVRWRTFPLQRGQVKMKMTLKVHQVTRFRSSNLLHKPRQRIIPCLFHTCDCDRERLKRKFFQSEFEFHRPVAFHNAPKTKL